MNRLFRLAQLCVLLFAALGLHTEAATLASPGAGCQFDNAGSQRCTASLGAASPQKSRSSGSAGQPLAATAVVVMPNKKTLMSGWVEYNPNTCQLISSGAWTVTTAPTKGNTSTGIVTAALSNGACPGFTFPFAVIYYTWTSTDPKDKSDAFTSIWTSPDFTNPGDFAITVANVDISAVDLNAGTITAVLTAPGTLKGPVQETFDGAGVSSSPAATAVDYASGTNTIPIDRPKITPGLYNKLTLTWTVDGVKLVGTYDKATWNVLGIIRYSQYNVPLESSCTGTSDTVWIVDSVNTCNFSAGTLNASFIAQTQLNGTGTSQSYGYVKGARATGVRRYCKGKFPQGATLDNTFVQVSSVTGSCNRNLVAGTSAATAGGSCSAVDLLVNRSDNKNFGSKNSDDTCPACSGDFRGTDGHIDSFSSNQSCSAHDAADLGNYWTLQTP